MLVNANFNKFEKVIIIIVIVNLKRKDTFLKSRKLKVVEQIMIKV